MKLLFDESLSPRLVELLRDLFPESESALRNGLAGSGDLPILEYASAGGFVLITTDNDFERLLSRFSGVNVVILSSCQASIRMTFSIPGRPENIGGRSSRRAAPCLRRSS